MQASLSVMQEALQAISDYATAATRRVRTVSAKRRMVSTEHTSASGKMVIINYILTLISPLVMAFAQQARPSNGLNEKVRQGLNSSCPSLVTMGSHAHASQSEVVMEVKRETSARPL